MTDHNFQVNLGGVIDLLSHHLYSAPHVYIRELLQNGIDAIRARQKLDPTFEGEIDLEVAGLGEGSPTLIFRDNGIGLTEDEVHKFLATIGESSKRQIESQRADFLGQFGIGLLSCFIVSDEIVMITRSARTDDAPTLQWRGKADGTYATRTLESESAAGTQVFLRAKRNMFELFAPDRVRDHAHYYGAQLPVPIRIQLPGGSVVVNQDTPPWRSEFANRQEEHARVMEFGEELLRSKFLDWIPLRSKSGGVEGVAYVLPGAASLAARPRHRVYLKQMLLSEAIDNLLPDWAFFVQCVVNTENLRPTASRESFYEDENLEKTKDELGGCLRDYIGSLAEHDPDRLQQLIRVHYRAIKALAVDDDEFFRLMIDWLVFPTSDGVLTFQQIRSTTGPIRYTPSVEQFRQIASIARAQGVRVVNAGYVFDADLIEKAARLFPDLSVKRLEASDMIQSFEDLTVEERDASFRLLQAADRVLRPYQCLPQLRKFEPVELPALYSESDDARFQRSIDRTREIADEDFANMLDVMYQSTPAASAELCLNFANPLVKKLASLEDAEALELAIGMLYVQSLLLGHHPLGSGELLLLNQGLIDLITRAVDTETTNG